MVEKLEINFSLAKKLYKASDCTDPYQIHVNTFVEVGGRNFESLLNQILRFTECLLEVAESFLVIQESHKPEVKVIHSNDFHVLLRWIFHISLWLALCIFLSGIETCTQENEFT